ncbi:MAG: GNAT family N-acetyltransferase [Woeseiaceae bacterium]|nr:GNAT family N-acetyltransferase [Woeseiaceae bacterium]
MNAVSVILASREHLKSIPGIELASAALFSERDLPANIRFRVTEPDDLLSAQQDERLWIAVNEKKRVVGFVAADLVDGEAYLQDLGVLPEFGKKGIGTRLVAVVVGWARDSGFSSLGLVTFKHLPWNAPFYAKLGFIVMDAPEYGPGFSKLFDDEKRLGINIENRVAMRLML